MKNINKISLLMIFCLTMACTSHKKEVETIAKMEVNLQHFNHLYKEININADTMAIVHIYSEYPDYSYAIEPSEGFTCVDDVARAIVMLSAYYMQTDQKKATLRKIEMLTKFVLHMQNENGYFNNFIWDDLTINATYKTTVAELNWWSLRALWALETAYPLVQNNEKLAIKITSAVSKLMENIFQELLDQPLTYDTVNTLSIPAWLPNQYAADQAGVLILGLLPYHNRTNDQRGKKLADQLANGIMQMQKGDENQYPYGVFLSWSNLWHAWGNSQAYALLKAGQQFNNEKYIKSALLEVDHFYPYMLKNGFAEAFWIELKDGHFIEARRNDFPVIAYGIRPMVWASMEAYKITGEEKYLTLTEELNSWFQGNNAAQTAMYDSATGRCYDGIISEQAINKNSGAESTIECLLTLLRTN